MNTLNRQIQACHEMPVLRRNDKQKSPSEDVKDLQRCLQSKGFPSLKVDGFFGKKTEDAVKFIQSKIEDHTLLVDGIVGPQTWETLGMCVFIGC